MRNGVAVVGDKDSVLAFKAIGLDVFPVAGVSEAIDKIHALARHYAVIFVTEKFIKTPSRLSKISNSSLSRYRPNSFGGRQCGHGYERDKSQRRKSDWRRHIIR